MGASFSACKSDPVGALPLQSNPSLGDLPESCAALILGYLDPPEICKLAKLNRAFRGASWADFIWESKLPSNYQTIVRKVFGDGLENLGKRDVYTRLCQPNSFDDGTKVGYLSIFLFPFCFVSLFSVWVSRKRGKMIEIGGFDLNCLSEEIVLKSY